MEQVRKSSIWLQLKVQVQTQQQQEQVVLIQVSREARQK